MELFQKITLILSLFAIISSFFSVVINIYLKKSVDVKLNQYELISEEQNRILKNLFDLEDYLTLLLRRYGGDATQLKEEITPEEKDEANKFISEINFGLSKMFLFTSDKEYSNINKNWIISPQALRERRYELTLLMRKMQHPKTKFNHKENIKFLHYF